MQLPNDPEAQLTTTRLGGGRSARLFALGVAAVLATVVYMGVSGQDGKEPSNDHATSRPVAVASPPAPASPSASVSVESAQPTAPEASTGFYSGATEISDVPGGRNRSSTLGVALTIGGRLSLASLNEVEPLHFETAYQVPLPVPGAEAKLLLLNVAYWPPSDNPYATWAVPLAVFDADSPPFAVLLDDTRSAQPDATSSAPLLVHNGYRMHVSGERNGHGGFIHIDLTIGSDAVERHWVTGDDGLIGFPHVGPSEPLTVTR